MTGCTSRISRKTLFKKLEILTLTSQYVLSLMRFPLIEFGDLQNLMLQYVI